MYVNAKGVELKLTNTGNLTITGAGGGVRTGSSGADMFDSISNDLLTGGAGDDVYNLWDSGSKVVEKAGEGVDTVYVKYWGGHQLAANVENVVLASDGANWATGNALNNVLVAGSVRATLDGGAGDDVLVGGAGADVFKIKAGNGSDAIYNFKPGWDAVQLEGYGFTSFTQLKSVATQSGADVIFKLSATESLVLRDIQLGSLGAADFALPMSKVAVPTGALQYSAGQARNANGWYVLNNAWGASGLTAGKDYTLDSVFQTSNMTKGTTFNWSFALSTELYPQIKAFPEVIFGISPLNEAGVNPTDTKMVLPVKVSDLVSLTAAYDVSFAGNTGGFNVAYDIWMTNKAYGDASSLTNEIMVWVHKGDFDAYGPQVGTYTMGDVTAKIYHTGTYTAVVMDKDVPKGTLDVVALLNKLKSIGIVKDSEYVASIELGAEVTSGAGSLTINDLNLRVETKAANGGTIVKTVTGAGASVTETAAPAPPPPPQTLLETNYKAGVQNIVDAFGATVVKTTTTVAADKVTVAKVDISGASLGSDIATLQSGQVVVKHYDGAGRFSGTDLVNYKTDGGVVTSRYTAGGAAIDNIRTVKDASGAVVTETYDANWGIKGVDKVIASPNGTVMTQHYNAKYAFTGAENLVSNGDGSKTLQHYNAAWAYTGGDVVRVSGGATTVERYDANWNFLGMKISAVEAGGIGRTVNYNASYQQVSTELFGSDRADSISASSGTTHIHGGLGADKLAGGSGVDYFYFDTAIGNGDIDTISRFSVATDKIVLDHTAFGYGGALGGLAAGDFVVGTKALDASDRVIFNSANGALYYDDDGSGAHAAILIAYVAADGLLSAGNFIWA